MQQYFLGSYFLNTQSAFEIIIITYNYPCDWIIVNIS